MPPKRRGRGRGVTRKDEQSAILNEDPCLLAAGRSSTLFPANHLQGAFTYDSIINIPIKKEPKVDVISNYKANDSLSNIEQAKSNLAFLKVFANDYLTSKDTDQETNLLPLVTLSNVDHLADQETNSISCRDCLSDKHQTKGESIDEYVTNNTHQETNLLSSVSLSKVDHLAKKEKDDDYLPPTPPPADTNCDSFCENLGNEVLSKGKPEILLENLKNNVVDSNSISCDASSLFQSRQSSAPSKIKNEDNSESEILNSIDLKVPDGPIDREEYLDAAANVDISCMLKKVKEEPLEYERVIFTTESESKENLNSLSDSRFQDVCSTASEKNLNELSESCSFQTKTSVPLNFIEQLQMEDNSEYLQNIIKGKKYLTFSINLEIGEANKIFEVGLPELLDAYNALSNLLPQKTSNSAENPTKLSCMDEIVNPGNPTQLSVFNTILKTEPISSNNSCTSTSLGTQSTILSNFVVASPPKFNGSNYLSSLPEEARACSDDNSKGSRGKADLLTKDSLRDILDRVTKLTCPENQIKRASNEECPSDNKRLKANPTPSISNTVSNLSSGNIKECANAQNSAVRRHSEVDWFGLSTVTPASFNAVGYESPQTKLPEISTDMLPLPPSIPSDVINTKSLISPFLLNRVGNEVITTRDLYTVICNWEVSCLTNVSPLTLSNQSVLKSYESFIEYYKTYFSFLINDIWENLLRIWNSDVINSSPLLFELESVVDHRDFLTIRCSAIVKDKNISLLKENCIVMAKFNTNRGQLGQLGRIIESEQRGFVKGKDNTHLSMRNYNDSLSNLKKIRLSVIIFQKHPLMFECRSLEIHSLLNFSLYKWQHEALLKLKNSKFLPIILKPQCDFIHVIPVFWTNDSDSIKVAQYHFGQVKLIPIENSTKSTCAEIVVEIVKKPDCRVLVCTQSDADLSRISYQLKKLNPLIINKESITKEEINKYNVILINFRSNSLNYLFSPLLKDIKFNCCIAENSHNFSEVETLPILLCDPDTIILLACIPGSPPVSYKKSLWYRILHH